MLGAEQSLAVGTCQGETKDGKKRNKVNRGAAAEGLASNPNVGLASPFNPKIHNTPVVHLRLHNTPNVRVLYEVPHHGQGVVH